MVDDTIVAVYDTHAHAELAVADLLQAGVPQSAISVHTNSTATATTVDTPRETGFWASLFGGESDHDGAVYDRSIDGGSTVVTVKVPEAHVANVTEILESHKPIDIDERATSYGITQTAAVAASSVLPVASNTTMRTGSVATDDVLQLSEESLAVGKRVVNRGGTRIRRYVIETPIEESVNLHSEKVVLERRPVTDGRPVGDFSEKTIEMTEMAEEAVVSKTARVYEEVGLRKEAADRTETVRDTVRKEEVEIEKIPGATSTTTTSSNKPVPPNPKI